MTVGIARLLPWGLLTSTTLTAAEKPRRRLPELFSGRRRALFAALLANGVLQFLAAIALAFAIAGLNLSALQDLSVVTVLAALALLQIALRAVELTQAERFGQDFVQETRLALLKSVLRARQAPDYGVAMTRMVNDLTSLKNWVALGVARSIVAVLSLCGCLAAAAVIDTRLAFTLALPIIAVLGLVAALLAPMARRTREARRERGRMASVLGEAVLNRAAIADRQAERRLLRRVSKRGAHMASALVRRMWLVGLLRSAPEAAPPLVILGFIAFDPAMAASSALGALLLATLVGAPLRVLARAAEYRTSYVEARRRLEAALKAPRRRSSANAPLSES